MKFAASLLNEYEDDAKKIADGPTAAGQRLDKALTNLQRVNRPNPGLNGCGVPELRHRSNQERSTVFSTVWRNSDNRISGLAGPEGAQKLLNNAIAWRDSLQALIIDPNTAQGRIPDLVENLKIAERNIADAQAKLDKFKLGPAVPQAGTTPQHRLQAGLVAAEAAHQRSTRWREQLQAGEDLSREFSRQLNINSSKPQPTWSANCWKSASRRGPDACHRQCSSRPTRRADSTLSNWQQQKQAHRHRQRIGPRPPRQLADEPQMHRAGPSADRNSTNSLPQNADRNRISAKRSRIQRCSCSPSPGANHRRRRLAASSNGLLGRQPSVPRRKTAGAWRSNLAGSTVGSILFLRRPAPIRFRSVNPWFRRWWIFVGQRCNSVAIVGEQRPRADPHRWAATVAPPVYQQRTERREPIECWGVIPPCQQLTIKRLALRNGNDSGDSRKLQTTIAINGEGINHHGQCERSSWNVQENGWVFAP